MWFTDQLISALRSYDIISTIFRYFTDHYAAHCKQHILDTTNNLEIVEKSVKKLSDTYERYRQEVQYFAHDLAVRREMSVLRGSELATEQRQLHLETMRVYLERIAKLPATKGEHEVTEDKLLSTKLEIKTLGKEIKG